MKNNMCIYSIKNKINGNFYIGSAVNFFHRRATHICELRKGKHGNKHLQRAWNKYGEANFEFFVLECVLDKNSLLIVEQSYLDMYKPEYNMCRVAGSQLGNTLSDEAKQKISARFKGIKKTEEHKEKIRQTKTGQKRPPLSDRWKRNLSMSVTVSKMVKKLEKILNESI